ncbi:MAG TPA: helix-turn-helix transcriptional regulator [Desulfosporosinus sp.]|nr:helix-turn-helix transcriptional regulator [Desulfosporosinus sp.]
MELWEVFKELVDEKGIKISDVVSATGIPYTTVDSIIRKQLKDIKFDNAVEIAKYFNVPVEYLITRKLSEKDKLEPSIDINLEGIELLNEYGIKRLRLYLEGMLLVDDDCLKKRG